jgi:type I restriction enzyme S subunit
MLGNSVSWGDVAEIKTGPFGSTLHADDYVSNGFPIITTEHFKNGLLPNNKDGLPTSFR